MGEVSRKVLKGVGPNGIDVRQYRDDADGTALPSVTTVLKTREDDKSNLYDWQDRNDGEGDNAFHEHLFWYSRHRGTLAHWFALRTLDPTLEWDDGDEGESERALKHFNGEEVANESPREVLYSVLKNQHVVESWGEFYDRHDPYENGSYYRQELVKQAKRDVNFFVETFEHICDTLGVTQDNIITVEEFLFNVEDGYAGQVDLVYECPITGETVVADLKTSSGCYDKHKIQGSAYGNSVETLLGEDVGRIEVWRIHPDSGQWAIHAPTEVTGLHTNGWWRRSYEDLLSEFLELAAAFEYEADEWEPDESITFSS